MIFLLYRCTYLLFLGAELCNSGLDLTDFAFYECFDFLQCALYNQWCKFTYLLKFSVIFLKNNNHRCSADIFFWGKHREGQRVPTWIDFHRCQQASGGGWSSWRDYKQFVNCWQMKKQSLQEITWENRSSSDQFLGTVGLEGAIAKVGHQCFIPAGGGKGLEFCFGRQLHVCASKGASSRGVLIMVGRERVGAPAWGLTSQSCVAVGKSSGFHPMWRQKICANGHCAIRWSVVSLATPQISQMSDSLSQGCSSSGLLGTECGFEVAARQRTWPSGEHGSSKQTCSVEIACLAERVILLLIHKGTLGCKFSC